MKICVAQTKPVKGDVQSNIENHKKIIDLAVAGGAETIVFPELSITGYEPELAKELATDENDGRFDDFQKISDAKQITIGIGAPIKNQKGVSISMILFQPRKIRQTYSKKYIHQDEEAFFIGGQNSFDSIGSKPSVALAICYELSVPEHAENAFRNGAEIYLTSVAKSADGVNRAAERLSEIATKYSMAVLMANCVGHCDNFECGGKTSAWNDRGSLVGQLNDADEGVLIFDTNTQETIKKTTEK